MRSLSIVVRWSRWMNPLPNDSGQRLKARGVEVGRHVTRSRILYFGDARNQNGAAGGQEQGILATHSGSCKQSGLDSTFHLNSTVLKSRALRVMASEVGGERSDSPLPSQNSNSEGTHNRDLSEEISKESELRSSLTGSVLPDSRNLETKPARGWSGGNSSGECRGLRDQSQLQDPPESGLYGSASSLEAGRSIRVSPFGKSSFVDLRNSNSGRCEPANDVSIHGPLTRFASQSSQFHSAADGVVASLQSEASALQTVPPLPASGPENRDVENPSKYPVPLTPFSGEMEKAIEYERAMVAETAMKSAPAIYRSDILFEDEWLMVINKPCGIYSEHVLASIPSLLQTSAPLVSDSSPKDENLTEEKTHLHMANRLDRDTSGLMIITKCKRAAGKMSKLFTSRWVKKSYIALCAAPPPTWKHLTVESGHGRSRFGAWRVYAKKDIGRELPGKCVVRDMRTHFTVVALNKELLFEQMDYERIEEGRGGELTTENSVVIAGEEHIGDSLPYVSEVSNHTRLQNSPGRGSFLSNSGVEVIIRAFPFTGRTHQIRLHCQYIGMPLRGDVKYGGPHVWNGVQYDHHALHAETLSFRHPFTSEKLFLVAPLPHWARDAGVQIHQA